MTSAAENWLLIASGAAFTIITIIIAHTVADVWDTWLGSARRCGCDRATTKLTPDHPLAFLLHGEPVEVGDWIILDRPSRPRREGEFRGVNARTGQIRVRLWSPTLGRFAKGGATYCDAEFVSSVTASLDPSMVTGRLVQHRAQHPVAVAS